MIIDPSRDGVTIWFDDGKIKHYKAIDYNERVEVFNEILNFILRCDYDREGDIIGLSQAIIPYLDTLGVGVLWKELFEEKGVSYNKVEPYKDNPKKCKHNFVDMLKYFKVVK